MEEFSEDNGARLMGACLHNGQFSLTSMDHKI